MKINQKKIKAAAIIAIAIARKAGRLAVRRAAIATDAALIDVGKSAQQRQSRRAANVALKVAGRAALVTGAVVGGVLAVRAARAKKILA